MSELQPIPKYNPWDNLPDRTFRTIQEVFIDMFIAEAYYLLPQSKLNVMTFWTQVRGGMNLYVIEDAKLSEFWLTLSDMGDVFDFVMKLATDLRFYLGRDTWDSLCLNTAEALTVHSVLGRRKAESVEETFSYMDDDFSIKMTSPGDMINIIQDNPWYLVLYLMSITDWRIQKAFLNMTLEPQTKGKREEFHETTNGIG